MFTPTAGITFAISAGVPATFDAAGYGALTFTDVGEIQDYSEFGGGWSNSTNKDASKRGVQKKKSSFDPGGFNLGMKLDTDDAGQILMKTAKNDATGIYAAEFTAPNGDVYYCQVLVNTFTVTPGNQDSDMMASTSCAVTTSSTDVDWVEDLAS